MARVPIRENYRVTKVWKITVGDKEEFFYEKDVYLKRVADLAQRSTTMKTEQGFAIRTKAYGNYGRPALTDEIFPREETARAWLDFYFKEIPAPEVKVEVSVGDMCPNTVYVYVDKKQVIKVQSDELETPIMSLLDALNVDYSTTRWD